MRVVTFYSSLVILETRSLEDACILFSIQSVCDGVLYHRSLIT